MSFDYPWDSDQTREQEALKIAQSIINNSYSKSDQNTQFAVQQASKRTGVPEENIKELLSWVQWEIKLILFTYNYFPSR